MITELQPSGLPGQTHSFSPKAGPGGHAGLFTHLAPGGFPGQRYSFSPKAAPSTLELDVVDGISVTFAEDDVNNIEVNTPDTAGVFFTELIVGKDFELEDTASVTATDVSTLLTSGVIPKPVTETASVTMTEASTLIVSPPVTDTASVAFTEASTLDVILKDVPVTDTASVAMTELVSFVVVGTVAKSGSETVTPVFTEASTIVKTAPTNAPRQRTVTVRREDRTIYVK